MLFEYKAVDKTNTQREGTVEAQNIASAIETVEGQGYTITSINPSIGSNSILNIELTWFDRVSNKEIVILSRQIATLFEAQVSALRIFRMLAAESENRKLKQILTDISDDLQGGASIAKAFSRHDDVFSSFYISMIKSGEESGTLEKTFMYLADYLDRMFQVISKAKNALVYPAFVITIFIGVMTLMLTLVIPSISQILLDSGQEIPVYTKLVIGLSDFVTNYFLVLVLLIAGLCTWYWQFKKTEAGKRLIDEFKLSIPIVGSLYQKLFLTRLCDNLSTMLTSGISMIQALEVSADVVDNEVYKEIIENTLIDVKGGRSFSESISEYPEIPGVLAQMSKVGEESGRLGEILGTLATFYNREVNNAVDTLVGLIEPAMIVFLGLGVGVLLASVLMPIYNITGSI